MANTSSAKKMVRKIARRTAIKQDPPLAHAHLREEG